MVYCWVVKICNALGSDDGATLGAQFSIEDGIDDSLLLLYYVLMITHLM